MIEAVSYALLCGFALSALLVPLTALAMRRATELGGATRHLVWFMVLIATVAATCAAFVVSAVRPAQQFSGVVVPTAAPTPGAVPAAEAPLALGVLFLACWLIVSLARMFLIARRVGALRAMKLRATPVEFDFALPRGARALASDGSVASAVGFLHPAILLPSGTIEALDPKDVRQIVLHEAAHLRRRDDLTGLAYLVCAAVFWFNPFVHHIGKKLSLECEIACDERVVEQTGDATRYATLLYEMAQGIAGGRPQPAWSGFVHPSGLVVRVRNVLYRDARRRALPRPALAVLVGILLSSVALAAFNAPALGRTETDASGQKVRPMSSDWTTHDGQTMQRQWVRDFPVCKVHNGSGTHRGAGMHKNAQLCDEPAMQSWPTMKVMPLMKVMPATKVTPSTTRVKKGTSTP